MTNNSFISDADPYKKNLQIVGLRGGTVAEITEFLSDFERAYNALYLFSQVDFHLPPWAWGEAEFRRFIQLNLRADSDFYRITTFGLNLSAEENLPSAYILPKFRLEVSRISIQSPGFWEFLGAINPLAQIRGYLHDRHERKKDTEYRNASEKQRLELDNEILQQQIWRGRLDLIEKEMEFAKKYGLDHDEIKQIVWRKVGVPLSKLGQHQDTGLIEGPKPD